MNRKLGRLLEPGLEVFFAVMLVFAFAAPASAYTDYGMKVPVAIGKDNITMLGELKEDEINRITAITSSSPAYVYLFAKAMLVGAQNMGINAENTLEMICKTIIGSANMILSDSRSVDELIRMVKSPNGTTERALNVFEEKGFIDIVSEAMKACADRADELSKLN